MKRVSDDLTNPLSGVEEKAFFIVLVVLLQRYSFKGGISLLPAALQKGVYLLFWSFGRSSYYSQLQGIFLCQ